MFIILYKKNPFPMNKYKQITVTTISTSVLARTKPYGQAYGYLCP